MSTREFRFGVAVGMVSSGDELAATARRVEDLGYASMVVADGLWLPAPFALLNAAAAVTSTLRLGTHVLATPLHAPAAVAQETDALDLLSGGRFELGLGTGRYPETVTDAGRLGLPFGTRAERVTRVAETIAAVRERFAATGRQAPAFVLAGVGRDLVRLAVEQADTLAMPVPFDRSEEGLAAEVTELRTAAGSRFDELELAGNVLAVGDKDLPPWVPGVFRDLPADSHGRLGGTAPEIAETLERRRDRTGISYMTVPQWSIDEFAPVVERLAGH